MSVIVYNNFQYLRNMSSIEFKLRKLLEDATFYIKNAEEDETYVEKSTNCLDEADKILLENTRDSFVSLSAEVIVMLVEASLLSLKRDDSAERVLDIFFQRLHQEDQFFCRALLAQSTIEERKIARQDYKGDGNLKQVNHAFSFIKRAIEISTRAENKQKYQFVVYNASIKTWHIIRGIMRPGWSKHLIEILEKVSNLLEEADDSDFNWRCRYLNALCKAMSDAEKKPEALKILDKLVDLTKKKGDCNFQEVLFRNRMHMYKDQAGVLANVKKETETGEDKNGFKPLYMIQTIKSGNIPEAQVEKELQLLMSSIAPSSVSTDPSTAQSSAKITPIMQDRIAECGRMAIKYNLIQYAEGACSVVARARQGSLRAKVWTEYTKAELLLKKPSSEIDPKTGMKLNTLQIQIEDYERRIEALKILDRAMIANKRLADADVTIEGCILIWNTGLPLLKASTRNQIYKPFQAAAQALEQLEANESLLRVCLHLELAKYEIAQDFLSKASLQLKKALMIDYSTVNKSLHIDLTEEDDPEDFQRPYDKALKFILKKLSLKTNLYGGDPDSPHELIILDVENAKTTKNTKMRQTLLDKAIKQLQELEEPEFEVKPDDNLVEEEIKAAERTFTLKCIRERKERVLINAEISNLAYEEGLVDLAFESATMCVVEKWDALKDQDLVIAQSQAHISLAKCYVEFLLEEEIEIGHKDLVTIENDQDEREFTAEQKEKMASQKEKFIYHIIEAVSTGQQSKQSWLVFNASIEFWNEYLPIFKKDNFYEVVHPEGVKAMTECFEAMNNAFIGAVFSSDNVDYELNKKMQIFSNLSILLARVHEYRGENSDAVRVCDTLLGKQLPSHLRKTFDSIKARVTKQVSTGPAKGAPAAGGAAAKGGKGAPEPGKAVVEPSKSDQVTAEVLSYLELIQNGNKEMIQKAMDSMNMWQPNEKDEVELELNVELWCRLGRLAIAQDTNAMFKVALYCADVAIKNGDEKAKSRRYMQIPVTRLRWYSVAEALYGEALYKLLDTQKQEKESQDKLLHASVGRFVESCNIAAKAQIGYLVLESAKSMWNAVVGILDAPNNRKLLIKPMANVHKYLRDVHENTDPDFLSLFYSALFQCIAEQRDWKLGEKITEEAFSFVPQSHQKVLWEAKMNFLSKLGKNVLSAISNMKESNASLMAKVWVRLARSSSNQLEQHSAYNKAIEILRKEESVEVVEVLIEYAEWMHRNKYSTTDVEDQLLLAVDLLMDIEPGWDDEDDEVGEMDEARTRQTGKSGGSRKSGLTRKSAAGRSVAKRSVAGKSMGGKSKVSKATMRSKGMRSTNTRQSKKTTTALSKRQEEESQPSFLNCSHFDKLIRIHSMLAMLAPDATKQREYALDAHFFIMKMWEQSFQTLNAQLFFEAHTKEITEMGYNVEDPAARKEYFTEIIMSGEMQIPIQHALPDKPEEWVNFEVPDIYHDRVKGHEDKIMVAQWTFMKPELTYLHMSKIANLLEQHYFSVQLLPVLKLMELFSGDVLMDKILTTTHMLHRARLMMNLGLKDSALELQKKAEVDHYDLNEEERKTNYEKIKALKDEKDNLVDDDTTQFFSEKAMEPHVVENIKIHESWLAYSEELIKWGEFVRAKELAKGANLHARILKDQDSYAKSLLVLGKLAYLEGDSAGALRVAMLCHKYAKDIEVVEQTMIQTFNLLFSFEKYDDCERLLNPMLDMLTTFRQQGGDSMHQTSQNSSTKQVTQQLHPNLPLEFAVATTMMLKAILCAKMSSSTKIPPEEQDTLITDSFGWADQFESQVASVGFKELHVILMLRYCKILWQEISSSVISDVASVMAVKQKLSQCAVYLLKTQDQLTNQVYYIGVHQDSISQSSLSLPLIRLLGVCKLRIAQINTSIGLVKNSIKTGSQGATGEQRRKLDKIVATFMDAVSKQIDANSNTYKKKMNRYEKSISILYSALNMIHGHCEEYAEALVEISRNRRLLAVNKKHLRGQWRQDAILVEEINMNLIELEDGEDRKDQLAAKGLEGEVQDTFVDYKSEMLRNFVELLNDKSGTSDDPEQSTFDRIRDRIGLQSVDNILGVYALEYAEGRANLNKEQAFYYLALFQYSCSRQHLLKSYLSATTETHPDIRRMRAVDVIKQEFGFFTTPGLPSQVKETQDEQAAKSKPMQILNSYFSIDYLKENMPNQSGFLIIQMSEDQQHLYIAYSQVNKDRKYTYYVTKMPLHQDNRDELSEMLTSLGQQKITMQKTPITIQEDLEALEKDSEEFLQDLMVRMEKFFEPMSKIVDNILNPVVEGQDEGADAVGQPAAGGKAAPPKKEEAKKAPAKAPPKGKAAGGQEVALAAYESTLPLTSSGIESLVVCIDHRIQSLPIESLEVFSKVSVISRDFNLHLHMNRLKNVGHQADLHNNRGINKEELRYIIDIPDSPQLVEKSEDFVKNQMGKLMPGSQWDGVLTKSQHIPSDGEWQRQISEASMFAYFSMTCLLHKFPSALISDLSIFNKCKAMVIFDRMNSFKTLIDRNVMTSKHFSADDQPMQQVALFTLCGLSSIVINQWSTTPEANLDQFETMMKGALEKGDYLGSASLKQHWKESTEEGAEQKPPHKLLYKNNTVTFGVPLLRVQ